MSVARGTKVDLYPARALHRGLGRDRRLGWQFSPRPSPLDVIKTPDPLSVLLPRPRDMWSPLARRGATGGPNRGTHSCRWDGHDLHSEQEHGNHALTQHDPGHSTTVTSIPLQ
jgi:hypothetical protein